MTSARKTSSQNPSESFIRVKHSKVHGQGVFATRKIPAGTEIIEYQGKRITEKQADKRFGLDPDNPHHTFFFSLDRKSTRLNSSHSQQSRMPSSA